MSFPPVAVACPLSTVIHNRAGKCGGAVLGVVMTVTYQLSTKGHNAARLALKL